MFGRSSVPLALAAATAVPAGSSGGLSLSFSTYLGGSGLDRAAAVAVDEAGNIYVVGWTDSANLPTYNAAQQRGGGVDAFVCEVGWGRSSARLLHYCTYLGGRGDDRAFGIAADAAGNAYVTG